MTTLRSDTSPVDSVPLAAPATIVQYYLHAARRPAAAGPQPTTTASATRAATGRVPRAGQFTTAPAGRRPFTFTAFGDQGVTLQRRGHRHAGPGPEPRLPPARGRHSYAEDAGHGLITDSYDPRVWDSFFIEVEPAAGNIPWQVAVGNHEMEAVVLARRLRRPVRAVRLPGPGHQLRARPRTTRSCTATSGSSAWTPTTFRTRSRPTSATPAAPRRPGWQAAGRAAGQPAGRLHRRLLPPLRLLHLHLARVGGRRAASTGPRCSTSTHVDLVINGHNHIYERTDPIRAGAPTGGRPDRRRRSTAATAGHDLHHRRRRRRQPVRVRRPRQLRGQREQRRVHRQLRQRGRPAPRSTRPSTWSRVRYTGYCLLVIDSPPGTRPGTASTLLVRGLSEDGSEIDRITLAR